MPGAQAEGGDAPGAVRELLAAGAAADSKNDDGMTPLMLAADAGRSACAAALVDGGAAVDTPALESHMTALHFAAQAEAGEGIVRALAAAGAAVEARTAESDQTALHLAAEAGRPGTVRALLEVHASPAATDALGATALHYAANAGSAAAVTALLEAGAAVGAATADDRLTALHFAAQVLMRDPPRGDVK